MALRVFKEVKPCPLNQTNGVGVLKPKLMAVRPFSTWEWLNKNRYKYQIVSLLFLFFVFLVPLI